MNNIKHFISTVAVNAWPIWGALFIIAAGLFYV